MVGGAYFPPLWLTTECPRTPFPEVTDQSLKRRTGWSNSSKQLRSGDLCLPAGLEGGGRVTFEGMSIARS